MKRILAGLFVATFAISGCSSSKSETITFMAKNKAGNLYALYNTKGTKLTNIRTIRKLRMRDILYKINRINIVLLIIMVRKPSIINISLAQIPY